MSRPPESTGPTAPADPAAPPSHRPAGSPAGRAGERHLVLRAQDGDTDAFEQLINRYQGRLFRAAYMILGNRQDSEDAVQESLILAWKRLHLLRDPEAFHGWLLRICTNEATSGVRRRSRHRTDPHDSESLEALDSQAGDTRTGPTGGSPAADPVRSSEVNAQIQALADVLSTIRPELSIVWVLREVETMSYEEIARTLNITVSTVRGRLARARSAVIQRMKEWT